MKRTERVRRRRSEDEEEEAEPALPVGEEEQKCNSVALSPHPAALGVAELPKIVFFMFLHFFAVFVVFALILPQLGVHM